MKKADKSTETSKKINELLSKISENEILNLQAMSYVRGGNADGTGIDPIIINPKF